MALSLLIMVGFGGGEEYCGRFRNLYIVVVFHFPSTSWIGLLVVQVSFLGLSNESVTIFLCVFYKAAACCNSICSHIEAIFQPRTAVHMRWYAGK